MSQILFQGNNLVVTGELWKEYYNLPNTSNKENLRRCLHINFIVQVNGKMVVHSEPITLIEWEPEEWHVWYTLVRVFFSFWYSFSQDRITMESNILRKWIEELVTAEKNSI